MLDSWDERPEDSRSLFNPAFSAAMICVASRKYDSELPSGSGMQLLMSFLILPLSLHTETRNILPRTTATSLTQWVRQHPEVHIGLADRVSAFRDITCEAIRYAVLGGIIVLTDEGGLRHVPGKPRGLTGVMAASEEVEHCFKAAANLGCWFARVPDPVFLFRTLRIRI